MHFRASLAPWRYQSSEPSHREPMMTKPHGQAARQIRSMALVLNNIPPHPGLRGRGLPVQAAKNAVGGAYRFRG